MRELPKTYDPRTVERRWYAAWLEKGYFHADENRPGPRFSVVIPPPNVTGSLTMGHVLNNTLQDILVRYQRMCGKVTLWMPGTDHAGIATQNVVERALAREGLDRHRLGRERFLERVWAWKEKYGRTILEQLQRLGCSCDWERERFTMDEGLSRAVREVFVRLYEKGLVYRGRRIIHWCPRCQTALSDEEAVTTEGGEAGHLWYIRYPAEDGGEGVVVATTRPETMLGDTGVAVHPEDERYRELVGKRVVLPLLGRPVPVVADDAVDPSFGTGAVKVTPAHDANDFEIGQRHGLPPLCVMDTQGRINAEGGPYAGLDRMEARRRIVSDLEKLGLLVRTEPYRVPVRRCQRCETVVEPYLSEQWFVRMKPLAGPAIEAVRTGRLELVPERWVGVYLHWLENIRDWCISRQLWWGHRIPVWYCSACGAETVAREDPDRCASCGSGEIVQDPDVLDTWFSSWLWPFSTMGWPERTRLLERFYPTDVLVTGADIIFFWVARMVMAGYEFTGDCPFRTVLFHSIVRDLQGRKMSKSLGNSPDPLEVIETYGADALRFTVVASAPATEDLRFAPEKTEFGRNFANKVWNAARFVLRSTEGFVPLPPRSELALPDRWILSRLEAVTRETRDALDGLRFHEAAMGLYRFFWGEFCDWYIELAKLVLGGEAPGPGSAARATLVHVLERYLRLLHPFMPFLTEEIWQALPSPREAESIVVAPYPAPDEALRDERAEREIGSLVEFVRGVRNVRAELGIRPSARLVLRVVPSDSAGLLDVLEPYVKALARVERIERLAESGKPVGEPFVPVEGIGEVYVPLRGLVDPAELRGRIARDLEKVRAELERVEKKLARKDFVERAPAEVVAKERAKAGELAERKRTLERHLETLEQAVS
ncbi:MAG: valine--tRNA ligase [Candidatus Binatia bacterium]|nr:MAG: valine--tRNA ligase [Candidatus Binatia bacterium]